MFSFRRRHVLPIALEIGPQQIHLIQLTAGTRPMVVAAGSALLPTEKDGTPTIESAHATTLVRQILAERQFVGRRVCAILPEQIVHRRTVRVAGGSAEQIRAAARRDASELFPFDLNCALVRLIRAGQVRQGNDRLEEVIVAAVQREDSERLLEVLHASGLAPQTLQLRPLAVYRAVTRLVPPDAAHAVIDVGSLRTTVTMGAGTTISLIRTIAIGQTDFQQAVARKLGLEPQEARELRRRLSRSGAAATAARRRDPVAGAVFDATRGLTEELAREIGRCFRYYAISFRGQPPRRAMLVGIESENVALVATVSAAIGVPVETQDLLEGIDAAAMSEPDRQAVAMDWAPVLGLQLPQANEVRQSSSDQIDPPQAMAA